VTYQRIVGVAGNIHRPSKTRRLVEAIGARAARTPQVDFAIYDLVDFGPGLGGALSRAELPLSTRSILRRIETADALIVGTPVYKGAYTGLFKHLFDLVDPAALRNVPVVLTATGGGSRHALVVEHHLRPLFGFFEALSLPTAVYACEADFADGDLVNEAVIACAALAAEQFTSLLDLQRSQAVDQPARLALAAAES